LALACGPRSHAAEAASAKDSSQPRESIEAASSTPVRIDAASGLGGEQGAPDEPHTVSAPTAEAPESSTSGGALSACCRALRDVASRVPEAQRASVSRVATECERLSTGADVAAAKRSLRGELRSIDPPAVCH
jgi:hypothetical protein